MYRHHVFVENYKNIYHLVEKSILSGAMHIHLINFKFYIHSNSNIFEMNLTSPSSTQVIQICPKLASILSTEKPTDRTVGL